MNKEVAQPMDGGAKGVRVSFGRTCGFPGDEAVVNHTGVLSRI